MPDPDLKIAAGEGGWSPQNLFPPFGPLFGPKIRGGGRLLPLDPLLIIKIE